MTGDLAVWLRAQLDADERVAAAARPGTWHVGTPKDTGVPVDDSDGYIVAETGISAEHIARHDPAFTLADITAKRAIINRHEPEQLFAPGGPCIVVCRLDDEAWPCPDLRLLAQPYAGRPGWREGWKIT